MSTSNITKTALAMALKDLMEERDFDQISVADICAACELNRKSFYYHFKDKYDLVNWIFYTGFFENIDFDKVGWELLEDLCGYLYSEKNFYKSALKIDGQNSFKEFFYQTLSPIGAFFADDTFSDAEAEVGNIFVFNGFISVLERWLNGEWSFNEKEFVDSFKKMAVKLDRRLKMS